MSNKRQTSLLEMFKKKSKATTAHGMFITEYIYMFVVKLRGDDVHCKANMTNFQLKVHITV